MLSSLGFSFRIISEKVFEAMESEESEGSSRGCKFKSGKGLYFLPAAYSVICAADHGLYSAFEAGDKVAEESESSLFSFYGRS